MACNTEKSWRRSGTTYVVAPVTVVRGSSHSSVMGVITAQRGPKFATPSLDAQFTR